MACRRVPNYAIDSPAIYIRGEDEAWDLDRIEREIAEETFPPDYHPIDDYYAGRTRFKLDAVETYLDRTKNPEEWKLSRELPTEQFYKIHALVRSHSEENPDRWMSAMVIACKYGVVDVAPESVKSEIRFRRLNGALTESTMLGIRKLAPDLVEKLGTAVYMANLPLSEAESKRSGS